MKLYLSQQIFEKSLNIKFNQNPSIGSRVVPCGRTNMKKLTVAFCNFANAPKNGHVCGSLKSSSHSSAVAYIGFLAPRASNLAMATPNINYEL
jgi:hypothetical protein